MKIHCNAGTATTRLVWNLPGYGEVWFHPEGIANILSLSKVKEKYRVTFDSKNGNNLWFTRLMGQLEYSLNQNREFTTMQWAMIKKIQLFKKNGTTFNTVDENKNKYSKRDVSRATLA